jgi:hypothetical protein
MKAILVLGVMVLFLLVGVRNTVFAMWCGTSLITNGMTKLDVISRCGQPDLKEVDSINSIGAGDRHQFHVTTSIVEVWHYNCGEGRFNRSLFFDGTALALVRDGSSRGSGPERCR